MAETLFTKHCERRYREIRQRVLNLGPSPGVKRFAEWKEKKEREDNEIRRSKSL